jgi:hypothetical protein
MRGRFLAWGLPLNGVEKLAKKKPNRDAELEKQVAEQSAAIVRKRGGKRPGAGRKPNFLKRSGLPPMDAHIILAHFDQVKLWANVLNSKSDDVRLRALTYLIDREQGKAPERVISAAASAIEVSFKTVDGERLSPEVAHRVRQNELEQLGLVPKSALAPAPEPAPAPAALPEPKAKVVGLLCVRHGEFVLPINAKSDMCPACIHEGEQAERRLLSLLPNA